MDRTPALLLGLGFLGGVTLALTHNPLWLLPLLSLVYPYPQAPRLIVSALLGFLYASWALSAPQLEEAGADGTAHLHLERISRSPYGKGWSYQARLRTFDGAKAKNLPVGVVAPNLVKGDVDYQVPGKLTQKGRWYRFKPAKGAKWEPVPATRSYAEQRLVAKDAVKAYLHRHLSPPSADFLAALVTGEITDRSQVAEFGRLGLAHLMAISGFHFSLVAALIAFCIRPLFPYKVQAILCILLLSGYFLFIGCTASVVRAWVMALSGLVALVIERRAVALNGLGCALILVLLIDPWAIFSVGFQFSFLCTYSILVLYAPLERALQRLFPRYRADTVFQMTAIDQHGFILATLIRKALALGLAVNVGALPLTLFLFHHFPWIGLMCNLFFPFLITAAVALLPLAALLPPLFWLEERLVQLTLDFTRYLPGFFDFQWVQPSFPLLVFLLILTLLLLRQKQPPFKREV